MVYSHTNSYHGTLSQYATHVEMHLYLTKYAAACYI